MVWSREVGQPHCDPLLLVCGGSGVTCDGVRGGSCVTCDGVESDVARGGRSVGGDVVRGVGVMML